MSVKEALEQYILEKVSRPKDEEIKEIISAFHERAYRRGDFFKEPFTMGNHVAFMSEGAVRVIIYKENGDEITARIRQTNSFIIDPARLEEPRISPIGIECLEDLTLLVAPIEKLQALMETNLSLNIVFRKHLTEQMLDLAKIQYLFLTGTAKERYQFILENNPDLLKKFPLRFIASMIGITPTQLSRVRNNKVSKK